MTSWYAPHAWLGRPGFSKDVLIETSDGVIQSVQVGRRAEPGVQTLGDVVIPGMVSAHSHAFHRVLRGHTHNAGSDFWAWRHAMYALAQRLEPEIYRALAGEVFGEMLRSGITTVGEFHYLHHQVDGRPYGQSHAMEMAVVGAARDVGIRMTLLDACYLTSDVTGAPVLPEQQRFSDGTVEAWSDRVSDLVGAVDHPTVKIGLAAHSVRSVSAQSLERVAGLSGDLGLPLHVHVSEQRAENDACLARHGVTPVKLLSDTGVLSGRTTAVHATHLGAEDADLLADRGAGVCFCPTTERELGDGIGPAIELRDRQVAVSLGSDSNAVVDMFEEARALELNDRLRLERRGIHSPEELMRSATSAGLAALGWGQHEPLAVGSPADFVALSYSDPALAGVEPDDGVGAMLLTIDHSAVTDVVVAGRSVVRAGQNESGHSSRGLHRIIRELLT